MTFRQSSRVTDPLSHYTTYDYDALDRLTRTTLHNGADTVPNTTPWAT